jgi:hypothetical protein
MKYLRSKFNSLTIKENLISLQTFEHNHLFENAHLDNEDLLFRKNFKILYSIYSKLIVFKSFNCKKITTL